MELRAQRLVVERLEVARRVGGLDPLETGGGFLRLVDRERGDLASPLGDIDVGPPLDLVHAEVDGEVVDLFAADGDRHVVVRVRRGADGQQQELLVELDFAGGEGRSGGFGGHAAWRLTSVSRAVRVNVVSLFI